MTIYGMGGGVAIYRVCDLLLHRHGVPSAGTEAQTESFPLLANQGSKAHIPTYIMAINLLFIFT